VNTEKKTQRADVNAIDGRSLMKCAVITINYLYDGKIINHAEIVPRSSKSRTPAADKNKRPGFPGTLNYPS
jgi:hypothetical protein